MILPKAFEEKLKNAALINPLPPGDERAAHPKIFEEKLNTSHISKG